MTSYYGLDSQFDPVEHGDERGGSQEVAGELVIAGGDTPPILDATEEVFDFVPPAIKALGTIGFLEGGVAARDDRQGTFVLDLLADLFAVVGLVGGDRERRSRRVQDLFDDLAVMHLSASHREAQRPTFAVDNRVDLRGSTATADADRLIFLPPLPHSLRGELSRRCCRSDTDCRATATLVVRKRASRSLGETSG